MIKVIVLTLLAVVVIVLATIQLWSEGQVLPALCMVAMGAVIVSAAIVSALQGGDNG